MSKILKAVVQPLSLISNKLADVTAAAALIFVGATTGNVGLIAAGISMGRSALAKKPGVPKPSQEQLNRLLATIDPRTPRKMVFGRTAMATDIRDQEFTDDQTYLHRFVVVASHKVNEVSSIWFDDKLAWTLAGGVQGDYVGYLTVAPILEGSAGNAINISARMGTTRRYTGCAYVHLRFKLTGNTKKAESPFSSSIPQRVTIVGDGAFVYDPRLDSTVVGGSGSCRADNQDTWIWDDDASRNPALQLAWYLLGWKIEGKLAVGKGIPPNRFNWPAFITAANECDEAVSLAAGGTEPRYRSDGVFSEGDAPTEVIDNLKLAMNAILDDVDGKIRPQVLVNDLGDPAWTFGPDDVLGDFTWEPTADLDNSFNIVRGTYPDPSDNSLYQFIDYPQIVETSPDGIDRIETFDCGMVQSVTQCQRLAKGRLQRSKFGGTFSAVMQVTAWNVQKGDVVEGTFAPAGFTDKLFRVADMEMRSDGTVPMVLREESATIYAWDDSEEGTPVEPVSSDIFDPLLDPIIQGIAEAAGAAPAANQTLPITAQVQTTGSIVIALSDGATVTIEASIKVDSLTGSVAQRLQVESREAGGTWAALGALESEAGGLGDSVAPYALRSLTNSTGVSKSYEVRAVTSTVGAGTGTIDPAQSFISVTPPTGGSDIIDGGGASSTFTTTIDGGGA